MRGRNNNNNNNGNRKAPNPLQRSYESNGPDVKVRGTAQHVAEKYLQLARDAQSSGDPVSAENYFQHAEHYYRILLAAQEQMAQQFGHSFPPNRAFNEDAEDGEEDGDDDQPVQQGGPQPEQRGQGGYNGNGYHGQANPRHEGEGGEGQRFDRPPRQNDRQSQDRQSQDRQGQDRQGNRRFDRNDRNGERRFERAEGGQNPQGGYAPRPDAPRSDIPVGGEQPDLAPQPAQGERRFDRPDRGPRPERRPRRERDAALDADQPGEDVAAALPSFLTNPVRVPVAVEPAAVAAEPPVGEPSEAAAEDAPKRPRRRRSPREVMDALGSEADGSPE